MEPGEADRPSSAADFRPGFRFARLDAVALVVIGGAAIAVAFRWPLAGAVAGFVLGHFFLFCNVFRIRRVPELIWAGGFLVMAGHAMISDRPDWYWPQAFLLSLVMAAGLIGREMRHPGYHGVWWRTLNPDLREWWEKSRT